MKDGGFMMKVEPEKDDIYFVVVLRHLGLDREIATLKVKRDYMMAFTPYSLDGSLGLDHHVSLKPSGERHVVSKFRVGDEMIDVPKLKEESIVRFEPPENLTCPVQIYVTGDPLGQFRGLRP